MTTGNVVAIIALAISAITLMANLLKDRRSEVLTSQTVRDKLDNIGDIVRDTREDVRALDRKLDDHATRITKVEVRMAEHDRRIESLEKSKE